MLDVILLALGFAFFALSIGYAYACDRLWGDSHDFRLRTRRPRDRGAAVLPHLRSAAARKIL